MTDIFDPAKRSDIMSRIRGKNTKPELIAYRYLRLNGIYFQKHYRSKLKIVMDLALPRKKRAVFIDGDFWHGRTLEKVISRRGEDDFWTKKLRRNIERDQQQSQTLQDNGWDILRIWESEIIKKSTRDRTLARIAQFLSR